MPSEIAKRDIRVEEGALVERDPPFTDDEVARLIRSPLVLPIELSSLFTALGQETEFPRHHISRPDTSNDGAPLEASLDHPLSIK